MKAYFFVNFYLSQIQRGIQAQHCTVELFLKYQKSSQQRKVLLDWAKNHKTTIILNGGNCDSLLTIFNKFERFTKHLKIPVTYFREDMDSLNTALTCVGIIVPEYNTYFGSRESDLVEFLKTFPLA